MSGRIAVRDIAAGVLTCENGVVNNGAPRGLAPNRDAPDLLDERRSLTTMVHDSEPAVTTPTQDDPTSVYLYYDRRNVLLYVGVTKRRARRNLEHTSKTWWEYVTRQQVEHYPNRQQALAREKRLIVAEKPPFNTQHNPDGGRLRELYHVVASQWTGESPMAMYRRLGHELPLAIREGRTTDGRMRLHSDPAHYELARGLLLPENKRIEVVSSRGGPTRAGRVEKVELIGMQAVIEVQCREHLDRAEGGSARLQTSNEIIKKGQFYIRHVWVKVR